MKESIERVVSLVDNVENHFENYDHTNVDSVGMLDIEVNSTELAINAGRQSEHNAEYIDIYDSLILRMQVLRSKVDAIKAKL